MQWPVIVALAHKPEIGVAIDKPCGPLEKEKMAERYSVEILHTTGGYIICNAFFAIKTLVYQKV